MQITQCSVARTLRTRRPALWLPVLLCLSLLFPYALAGARAYTAGTVLQLSQPSRADVATVLDLAARNALPAGYPTLDATSSIPPVLLKAIAWTESSWRQFRTPGHPLISPGGGYGIMQLTHGLGGTRVDAVVQSAIANNFIYNIASGARLLARKWAATPRIGDGDPTVLENWYYAVWAYNAWDWRNNPNNPRFTRKGTPLTNPQGFPYQERVFYFISHPPRDAQGHPLWTPVPVTLPPSKLIGKKPGPLPAPAIPHRDTSLPAAPLDLLPVDGSQIVAGLLPTDVITAMSGMTVTARWIVRNTGTLFWSGYSWRFTGDARITTSPIIRLPDAPPLADVPVQTQIVAPAQPGNYVASWQLVDPAGQAIGAPAALMMAVGTAPPSTPTALPIGPGAISPQTATPTVHEGNAPRSRTTTAQSSVDNATFVADVSIPDGTVLSPGQTFVKTWEIQNTGTTTWDSRYHWHFEAGAPLGTIHSVAAPVVPPGGTATFSVAMVAPKRPGTYKGWWQMTDPSGNVFGAQAWVLIRVGTPPTVTPTSTPTASAPTATSTPTQTPVPKPTLRPVSWFGPPASHGFFAEGYTSLGYQDYLSLLNPRAKTAHAQLMIYRADGATRALSLTLAPLTRRTLDMNVLAPRASTALRVEADQGVVVERAQYTGSGSGSIVAAVSLPHARWFIPEAYVGRGYADSLRIFNPYDVPSTVTITSYTERGSAHTTRKIVEGGTRLNIPLAQIARHGASSLVITGSTPVVVESVVDAAGTSGPVGAMGVPVPSKQWYFPDGGTAFGDKEYIALYNPDNKPATVAISPISGHGLEPRVVVRIPAHARGTVALHGVLPNRSGLAVSIKADRPVVAQEVRYTHTGGAALLDGATYQLRNWALADGYVGTDFKEWIALFNPGEHSVSITVRLIGRNGVVATTTIRQAAHRRTFLQLNGRLPNGPVAAVIHANRPIVVGRTLLFNGGKGLSTTTAVALGQ